MIIRSQTVAHHTGEASTTNYAYDEAGRLTHGGGFEFEYDGIGQLVLSTIPQQTGVCFGDTPSAASLRYHYSCQR
ncbi:MAG: hypothetical protein ACI9OJ_001345 [Myxococcota bacterium]|jgi:hypothetical protein